MDPLLSQLLTPLQIGSAQLRNRIVVTGHATRNVDAERLPNDDDVAYFAERSRGGAAMLTTGTTAVHPSSPTPYGIYATTLTVDGLVHPSLTNVGTRPTFDESDVTVETYVMNYSGDLYGKRVRLGFVQRLRDERKFDDVDALRAQMEADKRWAERLFSRLSV